MVSKTKEYTVQSFTEPGKHYIVRHFEESGVWRCNCPWFLVRGDDFKHCKHIKGVKKSLDTD